MSLLYTFLIYIYGITIKIVAVFNDKARMWVNGRKEQSIPDLKNKKVIWMHCSSLGEFEQGRPVFEKLKHQMPDYIFVLSFFSPSGFNSMKNYKYADYILYLPLDLPTKAKKFIDKINPEISIFVKYDFWYNYLKYLNDKKRKVVFISVLLEENHRLFKSINKIILNQLRKVDKIFTQDDSTVSILKNHDLNNVEKAGDTRIDRVVEITHQSFSDKIIERFISNKKEVFICGSTWEKDIDILSANKELLVKKYNLIIAPHEISEKQINHIIQKFSGYKINKYSENNTGKYNILIIDKIGILSRIYRYADIAYIGGGFGKSIHNTLEPGAYMIPVIFGPNYKRFTEANYLVSNNSFFSINDANQFEEIIISLSNKDFYKEVQNRIGGYFEKNKNASSQIVRYIKTQTNS